MFAVPYRRYPTERYLVTPLMYCKTFPNFPYPDFHYTLLEILMCESGPWVEMGAWGGGRGDSHFLPIHFLSLYLFISTFPERKGTYDTRKMSDQLCSGHACSSLYVRYRTVRYGVRYGTAYGTVRFHNLCKPSRNQCCGIRIQTPAVKCSRF
jgi:hypothetical protein